MVAILFQIIVHIIILEIYFSMNKQKQSARTVGPLPEGRPAVSEAVDFHKPTLSFLNQKED